MAGREHLRSRRGLQGVVITVGAVALDGWNPPQHRLVRHAVVDPKGPGGGERVPHNGVELLTLELAIARAQALGDRKSVV